MEDVHTSRLLGYHEPQTDHPQGLRPKAELSSRRTSSTIDRQFSVTGACRPNLTGNSGGSHRRLPDAVAFEGFSHREPAAVPFHQTRESSGADLVPGLMCPCSSYGRECWRRRSAPGSSPNRTEEYHSFWELYAISVGVLSGEHRPFRA